MRSKPRPQDNDSYQGHREKAPGRFKRYKEEEGNDTREPVSNRDWTLERLMTIWKDIPFSNYQETYSVADLVLRNAVCGREDIERFSVALAMFSEEREFRSKAGIFLSALINNGCDSCYTVHTDHVHPPSALGYMNTKIVRVRGDVGDLLGWAMRKGCIEVSGDAGDSIGPWMEGGLIRLNGGWKGISDDAGRGAIYAGRRRIFP